MQTAAGDRLRITVSLAGLHRVERGAEVALEAVAGGLAARGHDVTVIGSGPHRPSVEYEYRRVAVIPRERFERWPAIGPLREPTTYEALTFAPGLAARYRPSRCDVTMTCGFPIDNLVLRRPVWGRRPAHVFVTQNGDWPAQPLGGEARLFGCDGLVCTNPIYLERNRDDWMCELIPNAVDTTRFHPGPPTRERLGLPPDRPVVLMVSALIDSKRVEVGVRAVAELDDAVLVVAGDGPERERIEQLGARLLGDRFIRRTFGFEDMPDLYRSADAFFHPTLLESFGNVYVEAMACGLAVVAHRSAVTEWIVDDTGALIDTETDCAVVEALRTTLGGGPARAERAVERVRRRFTWPIVAERYEQFFQRIVAERRVDNARLVARRPVRDRGAAGTGIRRGRV